MNANTSEARAVDNGSGFIKNTNLGATTSEKHTTSNAVCQALPLLNPQGVTVALIRGDELYRSLSGRKHMLRIPPAWAFDAGHIDLAQRAGVRRVTVYDRDDGATYRVDFPTFLRHCKRINRGAGEQIMLGLCYWQVARPGAGSEQLSLGL